MKVDLEKSFCPKHGKLDKSEETLKAQIVDAELDVLDCVFNGDDSVEIKTENLTYISLTTENLKTLIRLIQQAEIHYLSK